MLAGVFSCVFALASVFPGIPAFAHDAVTGSHNPPATTASQAAAGDKDDMKNFLLHVRQHLVSPNYSTMTISAFRLALNEDGGDFKSGSVYVIMLDPEDGQVIIHGEDKSVEDRRLLSTEDTELPDLKMLIDDAKADTDREGVCREYMRNGETRTSCALLQTGRVFGTAETAIVVGYDVLGTDLSERDFQELPGSSVELDLPADQVETAGDLEEQKDALKRFVHSAIDAYFIDFVLKGVCDFSSLGPTFAGIKDLDRATIKDFIPRILESATSGGQAFDPSSFCNLLKSSLYRSVIRSEEGPWKSGSVYLFGMDDDVNVQRVLFNGNDAELEDKDLKVFDEGERNVGKVIIDAVKGAPKGEGVFVEYCWDDPDYEGDEVRDEDGKPIPGKAPSKSYKLGYVINTLDYIGLPAFGDSSYIFGSGIYPKEGEGDLLPRCEFSRAGMGEPMEPAVDDDGACAIAGTDNTPQSTVFNLFLMVSALFLAVSFGKRVRA